MSSRLFHHTCNCNSSVRPRVGWTCKATPLRNTLSPQRIHRPTQSPSNAIAITLATQWAQHDEPAHALCTGHFWFKPPR
eukprot:12734769-Alexandrium_andersonii.AAC.1